MRCGALCALAAALALAPGPARAQGGGAAPSDADAKRAEELFQRARKLMTQGRAPEACPLFEESQRLDPGGGTLLNLAECHAQAGKTATAKRELEEVVALARAAGRADAERTAAQSLEALRPKLSWLTVEVPPETAALAGLEVTRNGAPLPPSAWGAAEPVDPGTYQIVARAPGRSTWAAAIVVGPSGDRRVARIAIAAAPGARSPGAPDEAGEGAEPPSTLVGWKVGAGIGALAAGTAMFGMSVYSTIRIGQVTDGLQPYLQSQPAGVDACAKAAQEAGESDLAAAADDLCTTGATYEVLQWVFMGAGFALTGAGAYLLATSPSTPKAAGNAEVRLVPRAGATGGGLSIAGVF